MHAGAQNVGAFLHVLAGLDEGDDLAQAGLVLEAALDGLGAGLGLLRHLGEVVGALLHPDFQVVAGLLDRGAVAFGLLLPRVEVGGHVVERGADGRQLAGAADVAGACAAIARAEPGRGADQGPGRPAHEIGGDGEAEKQRNDDKPGEGGEHPPGDRGGARLDDRPGHAHGKAQEIAGHRQLLVGPFAHDAVDERCVRIALDPTADLPAGIRDLGKHQPVAGRQDHHAFRQGISGAGLGEDDAEIDLGADDASERVTGAAPAHGNRDARAVVGIEFGPTQEEAAAERQRLEGVGVRHGRATAGRVGGADDGPGGVGHEETGQGALAVLELGGDGLAAGKVAAFHQRGEGAPGQPHEQLGVVDLRRHAVGERPRLGFGELPGLVGFGALDLVDEGGDDGDRRKEEEHEVAQKYRNDTWPLSGVRLRRVRHPVVFSPCPFAPGLPGRRPLLKADERIVFQ